MVNATRLNGLNPLSYLGVNPYTPVPLFIKSVAPTSTDAQNFTLGTLWVVIGAGIPAEIWMLVSLAEGIANWIQLFPGSGSNTNYVCNTGAATPSSNTLNVLGSGGATTSGSGDTVTIDAGGGSALTFDADSGSAVPSGGVIIMAGGSNINTSASGYTVVINLNDNVSISGDMSIGGTLVVDGTATFGGTVTFESTITIDASLIINGNITVTGTSTFNGPAVFNGTVKIPAFGEGVVQSDSSGDLFSNKGTDGQVIIGSSVGAPAWANLTSTDGSIGITNGHNTIDLSASGGGGGTPSGYFSAYIATDLYTNGLSYPFQLGQYEAFTVINSGGGAFYPGDGASSPAVFTAPATGYYTISYLLGIYNNMNLAATGLSWLKTTQGTYFCTTQYLRTGSTDMINGYCENYGTFVVPMNMGDTATFYTAIGNNCYVMGTGYYNTINAAFPAFSYNTFVQGYRVS